MKIRSALTSDAADIAKVHVDSWKTTYNGIVPNEYLSSLSYESKAAMWVDILQQPHDGSHTNVLVSDSGGIIGFSSGGYNRIASSEYTSEIYAIYLLKEFQKKGLGRKIFQSSISRFKNSGSNSFMLWVLADNPTYNFYANMGGVVFDEKEDEIGGKNFKELGLGWKNI